MLRSLLPLTLLLACTAGCSSPSVWRSAAFSPESPSPTLLAASAFNYAERTSTVDLTGFSLDDVDWEATFEATAQYALENPDEVKDLIDGVRTEGEKRSIARAAVAATAPALHAKAVALLEAQGFAIQTDAGRAQGLEKFNADQDFLWSAPETVANPFGIASDRDGLEVPGDFPMWGPESKKSLRDALASGAERETFASIQGQFVPVKNDPAKGFTCYLVIYVLDQDAKLVFSARTEGTGNGIEAAFDAALALMQEPVIEPVEG